MEYMKKILSRNREKGIKPIHDISHYNEAFEYPDKMMRLMGIRLDKHDSPFIRTFWNVYYWLMFMNIIMSITSNLIRIGVMVSDVSTWTFDDTNRLFSMMPCVSFMIIGLLKTYKMVVKRSVYDNLISELRDMWPKGPVPEEDRLILSNATKQLKIVVLAYYISNHLLCASFIIPPMVDVFRRLVGEDLPRVLPFPYWLPWDALVPGIFELTLAWQVWHTVIGILFMLASDLLFFIFLSHIATQFELLSARIRRLIVVPIDQQLIPEYPLGVHYMNYLKIDGSRDRYVHDNEIERKYEREIKEIINRHRALIRLSNDVEYLFSFAMFLNFLICTLIICFSGFCCVRVEKWNDFKYKMFLMTTLSQMWLLCWFGEKVLESSRGISTALYASGWYKTSKKIRTVFLIMMHRAQREVHMTTYGFTVICLASYSTDGSVFTAIAKSTLLQREEPD